MKKKIGLTLLFSLFVIAGIAQSNSTYDSIVKEWQTIKENEVSTTELTKHYTAIGKKFSGETEKSICNNYYYITVLGARAEKLNMSDLVELPVINLNDSFLLTFIKHRVSLLERYYTLQLMKEGYDYASSKNGMYFNTSQGGILKDVDYIHIKEVLLSKNDALKQQYAEIISRAIRYNGLTSKMIELLPLIEKHIPECDIKKEVLTKFKTYEHLLPGKQAPEFVATDFKGNECKLSDYRGKTVVIDVWATWCHGCIEKLPYFLKIRDQFKDNKDVVFLVLSIDNRVAYSKWKFAHPKLNLMNVPSFIAVAEENDFSKDYNITGIPRYMIIDKEGKIVSVYAPSPDNDLAELIKKTI